MGIKIKYIYLLILILNKAYPMELPELNPLESVVFEKDIANLGIKTDSELINLLPKEIWFIIANFLNFNDKFLLHILAPRIGINDERLKDHAKKISASLYNFIAVKSPDIIAFKRNLLNSYKFCKDKESRDLILSYLKELNKKNLFCELSYLQIKNSFGFTEKLKFCFNKPAVGTDDYEYVIKNRKIKAHFDFWKNFNCSEYFKKSNQKDRWKDIASFEFYDGQINTKYWKFLVKNETDLVGLKNLALSIKRLIVLYDFHKPFNLYEYKSKIFSAYCLFVISLISLALYELFDSEIVGMFIVIGVIIFSCLLCVCINNIFCKFDQDDFSGIIMLQNIYKEILLRLKREKFDIYGPDENQLESIAQI